MKAQPKSNAGTYRKVIGMLEIGEEKVEHLIHRGDCFIKVTRTR